jgi:glycosyltransferase involved in cell wall biosynthesis
VKSFAGQVARKMAEIPVDVIFSDSSIPISLLDCRVPIIYWCDATFAGMVDFYPGFSHLQRESIENGNRMEQAAISRAALAMFSSDWAARTCRSYYQVSPSRIEVVPFGPNLDQERSLGEVEKMIGERVREPLRLIFSGTDWQRKGGELSLRLAEALNRAGTRTELTVVGCQPFPGHNVPDYVKAIGYLDISKPAGIKEYEKQLSRSHFLVLPTYADCTPRVICEANALGVPCITSDVGGLPSMIRKDINGAMFPTDDGFVASSADYILGVMRPGAGYSDLAARTVRDYKERHAWEISARRIVTLLELVGTPSVAK